VLFDEQGNPKLVDFGTRALSRAPTVSRTRRDPRDAPKLHGPRAGAPRRSPVGQWSRRLRPRRRTLFMITGRATFKATSIVEGMTKVVRKPCPRATSSEGVRSTSRRSSCVLRGSSFEKDPEGRSFFAGRVFGASLESAHRSAARTRSPARSRVRGRAGDLVRLGYRPRSRSSAAATRRRPRTAGQARGEGGEARRSPRRHELGPRPTREPHPRSRSGFRYDSSETGTMTLQANDPDSNEDGEAGTGPIEYGTHDGARLGASPGTNPTT